MFNGGRGSVAGVAVGASSRRAIASCTAACMTMLAAASSGRKVGTTPDSMPRTTARESTPAFGSGMGSPVASTFGTADGCAARAALTSGVSPASARSCANATLSSCWVWRCWVVVATPSGPTCTTPYPGEPSGAGKPRSCCSPSAVGALSASGVGIAPIGPPNMPPPKKPRPADSPTPSVMDWFGSIVCFERLLTSWPPPSSMASCTPSPAKPRAAPATRPASDGPSSSANRPAPTLPAAPDTARSIVAPPGKN